MLKDDLLAILFNAGLDGYDISVLTCLILVSEEVSFDSEFLCCIDLVSRSWTEFSVSEVARVSLALAHLIASSKLARLRLDSEASHVSFHEVD